MLSTHRGSENGMDIASFEAGKEYDLSATSGARDLAAVFLREGWAVAVTAEHTEGDLLGNVADTPTEAAPKAPKAAKKRKAQVSHGE